MCFNETRRSVLTLQFFKAVPTEMVSRTLACCGRETDRHEPHRLGRGHSAVYRLGNISRSPEANREHIALAHFRELPWPDNG
jgi:hypothetical protein